MDKNKYSANHDSFEDPIEHYRQITLKNPQYAINYLNWGIALLSTNRFLEARGVIQKAVEMNPVFCDSSFAFNCIKEYLEPACEMCKDWAWPTVQLGADSLRKNQLDRAESYLMNLVKDCSICDYHTYARGFEYLCQIIFRKYGSNVHTARLIKDICLKDIEKHGKHPWSSLYLGAVFKIEGNLTQSCYFFEKTANSRLTSSFTHAAQGCLSFRDYKIISDTSNIKNEKESWINRYLSDIVFHENPKQVKDSSVLFLTCCDQKYFSLFAENLACSCLQYNLSIYLHFHVVNPDENTFEQWESLKTNLPNSRISFSYEKIDILNLKAYYSMVRFLRVIDFMERYNKDIILIDTDSVVIGDLSPYLQFVDQFDVCLEIKKDDNYFPWRSIPAGLIVGKANPNSKIFFSMIFKYLEKVFLPNTKQNFWWIDQNALFAAYNWCQQHETSIKIGNLYDFGMHKAFDFAPNSAAKKENFVKHHKKHIQENPGSKEE